MKYRKLTELKKLEGNPRVIRGKQFKTLVESIKTNPQHFEARPLILSNRTGELVIIAGNQRYEAAKTLKLKEVPTFLIEGLSEAKEKEIAIRDNVSNGEWDMDTLASWDNLPLADWGVDIQKNWLSGSEKSGGILRENFNRNQVNPDEDDLDEYGGLDKFPITFILTHDEYKMWDVIKEKIKLKDDKAAFLKLLRGM